MRIGPLHPGEGAFELDRLLSIEFGRKSVMGHQRRHRPCENQAQSHDHGPQLRLHLHPSWFIPPGVSYRRRGSHRPSGVEPPRYENAWQSSGPKPTPTPEATHYEAAKASFAVIGLRADLPDHLRIAEIIRVERRHRPVLLPAVSRAYLRYQS